MSEDDQLPAAGERSASLAQPLGSVCKPPRGSGSWCFDVPDVTVPQVMV